MSDTDHELFLLRATIENLEDAGMSRRLITEWLKEELARLLNPKSEPKQ